MDMTSPANENHQEDFYARANRRDGFPFTEVAKLGGCQTEVLGAMLPIIGQKLPRE